MKSHPLFARLNVFPNRNMSAQAPLRQRPLRRTYLASFVGALAIIAVGLGAAPAHAAGSFLPGYDPGVRGTIDYGIANCGIVLFEAANFQGKKICAAEERWPLSQPYVARVGGDMEWREKVSSVQVRPGYVLMLEDKQFVLRGFQADVPNLGDWNDRAWTMWVTGGCGGSSAAGAPRSTRLTTREMSFRIRQMRHPLPHLHDQAPSSVPVDSLL